MNYKKGQVVITPDGKAKIIVVDSVDKTVRVQHLEARTPVTDYRFSDLKLEKEKPQQIEAGEWLYKGCFIQKNMPHPQLVGNFVVFKNNQAQDHVGRCFTFAEAKKLCKENECLDNYLIF